MKIFDEIKEISGKGFEFVSLFGYIIAAFNISLSISFLLDLPFSLYIFLFFVFFIFVLNFIFSAITALYIDMQTDLYIRAKDFFYFYGITSYLSFLLIPFSYFYLYKGKGLYLFFITGFLVWLWRCWFVKKKSSFGIINSIIAVFFPHIIAFVSFFVVTVIASIVLYLYG
jgi:hypothetical protein